MNSKQLALNAAANDLAIHERSDGVGLLWLGRDGVTPAIRREGVEDAWSDDLLPADAWQWETEIPLPPVDDAWEWGLDIPLPPVDDSWQQGIEIPPPGDS